MNVSSISAAASTDLASFGAPDLVAAAATAADDGNMSEAPDIIGPAQAATAPGTALKVDVIA
jgi:hypothetical protein